MLRIDPPVDARYLHTTYLLDLAAAAGVRVVNHPAGVRALHEKLLTLALPDLSPATVVGACPHVVEDFVRRHGRAVLKPVDGFAGTDVWLVDSGPGCRALVESATQGGRRHVIAQEYLPAVAAGNKRLFLLDGEIIGAVLRRPSAEDFRIGAPVAEADVDEADERIAAALARCSSRTASPSRAWTSSTAASSRSTSPARAACTRPTPCSAPTCPGTSSAGSSTTH